MGEIEHIGGRDHTCQGVDAVEALLDTLVADGDGLAAGPTRDGAPHVNLEINLGGLDRPATPDQRYVMIGFPVIPLSREQAVEAILEYGYVSIDPARGRRAVEVLKGRAIDPATETAPNSYSTFLLPLSGEKPWAAATTESNSSSPYGHPRFWAERVEDSSGRLYARIRAAEHFVFEAQTAGERFYFLVAGDEIVRVGEEERLWFSSVKKRRMWDLATESAREHAGKPFEMPNPAEPGRPDHAYGLIHEYQEVAHWRWLEPAGLDVARFALLPVAKLGGEALELELVERREGDEHVKMVHRLPDGATVETQSEKARGE